MLLKQTRQSILETGLNLYKDRFIRDMQGNISVCDPKTGLIAITPSAIPYIKRRLEDICIIDINGKIIEGARKPTSELALHTEIYKSRKDCTAVIHTHPINSTVFAITHESIPCVLSEVAMGFAGDVPCAPYTKLGTPEVGEKVVKAMGISSMACIMANHGLVTIGSDLSNALHITYAVEDTAEIIIKARSMNSKIHTLY